MTINQTRVNEIFMNCLFNDDEIVDGKPIVEPVLSEGVNCSIGFHSRRLEDSRSEIEAMIELLPIEFKEGSSFLNLCNDKYGNTWTGMHKTCDELLMLGIAIGKMKLPMPREFWSILPGGVPYIQTL